MFLGRNIIKLELFDARFFLTRCLNEALNVIGSAALVNTILRYTLPYLGRPQGLISPLLDRVSVRIVGNLGNLVAGMTVILFLVLKGIDKINLRAISQFYEKICWIGIEADHIFNLLGINPTCDNSENGLYPPIDFNDAIVISRIELMEKAFKLACKAAEEGMNEYAKIGELCKSKPLFTKEDSLTGRIEARLYIMVAKYLKTILNHLIENQKNIADIEMLLNNSYLTQEEKAFFFNN